jgi:hypothetical protein
MADVTITPSENGPYLVSGPVHLTAPDGHEIPHPDQFAMCRCGAPITSRSATGPTSQTTSTARWPTDGTRVALGQLWLSRLGPQSSYAPTSLGPSWS